MRQLTKSIYKVMVAIILISMLSINLLSVNVYAYADTTIDSLTDVKKSDWYYVTLGEIVNRGIITGYPDKTFKPQNHISRAEFTKIIIASLGLDIVEGNSFDDTETHWAKDLITTAVEEKIIDKSEFGYEFMPDKQITRIEMAKMVVRALGLDADAKAKAGVATEFKDDSAIANADKGYVALASTYGIVKGYTDKTFKPNGLATRAEASQMLLNMLNVEIKEEEDVVTRVNEKLQNRDVEIKLLKGIKSVAVHEDPQTYEELIENVESLKEYNYSGKKGTWEMLDISQVVSNNDYDEFVEDFVGVVKMDLPSEGFKLSSENINGKEYNTLYCDTLFKDGFETGRMIKDGEIIGRVNKTNGYYGVGLVDEAEVFSADYIGFVRRANNFISSSDTYDRVLVIFENPLKK